MTPAAAARGFVFVLAVLAVIVVALLPAAGALVLVHRHTHRPVAFWLWLAGFLVYAGAVSIGVTAVIVNSGFIAWVGP